MYNVLIIGLTWPEPLSTAAGTRMRQLIHFFLELKCQVTFASTGKDSPLSIDFEPLKVIARPILLNHDSFDEFIKDLRPDIVLFDRFLAEEQFGWRVAQFAPHALQILDTEDLHSLRHVRRKAFLSEKTFSVNDWLQDDMTKREMASIYRSDLSLIISTFEMELLTKVIKMPDDILMHLPFLLETIEKDIKSHWPSYETRQDFVFIGNGRHAPNIDAIAWLKDEIWPLIRQKLPDAQLRIYGAYLPDIVFRMHNPQERFLIYGQVENIGQELGMARVNLAPLRFGAGIKGKLSEAMISGTPNVTTPIGSEGMHDSLAWAGAIADTSEQLAEAAIRLYTNKSLWLEAQERGRTIINTLYDKKKLQANLRVRIEKIRNNLNEHRAHNFIGQMLTHQTMLSTKYLSKWIEAKNKNI
ncbi:MAG: glycosyltransferase family 4 protein [Maribacter sp.]|nr:glycosyltransferase family 4 protein [Maribacter sp.]